MLFLIRWGADAPRKHKSGSGNRFFAKRQSYSNSNLTIWRMLKIAKSYSHKKTLHCLPCKAECTLSYQRLWAKVPAAYREADLFATGSVWAALGPSRAFEESRNFLHPAIPREVSQKMRWNKSEENIARSNKNYGSGNIGKEWKHENPNKTENRVLGMAEIILYAIRYSMYRLQKANELYITYLTYQYFSNTKNSKFSQVQLKCSLISCVATSPAVLRSLCDSPRTGCARRTKICMRGASKQ